MQELKILVLDDEEIIRKSIALFLEKNNYNVTDTGNPSEALKMLEENEFDIAIVDYKMPEMDGLEVLKRIKKINPDIEVIMITGHGENEIIIEAMRNGAFDFFNKPISTFDIENSIKRTKKFIEINNNLRIFKNNDKLRKLEDEKEILGIIGNSPAFKEVLHLAEKASGSIDTSVTITGETGTGKEVIAKAIHYNSNRKERFFYTVNCSAIPEGLIESELFGHVKGAFTGAVEDKIGCFEAANGGTIFLDEIGDMPLLVQSKLLRVLEERKIKKIGSNKEVNIDVRVLSATNKNLKELIKENKFRSDLYYRLNAFEINIPPLRERAEDIPLLVDFYIKYYSENLKKNIKNINKNALDALCNYNFPGNIRELKNIIERAVILSESGSIELKYIPIANENKTKHESNKRDLLNMKMLDIEKSMILQALENSEYNISNAASLMGISRQSFYRKAKKYNIDI